MKFDFSITNRPMAIEPVALRTVYAVYADPTYDVKKKEVGNKDLIALRTTGGVGIVAIEGIGEMPVGPGTLIFFEHDKVRRYFCSGEKWDFWWFEFASGWGTKLPLNKVFFVDYVEGEAGNCNTCMELLRKNDNASLLLASATLNILLHKWLLHIESREVSNPHQEAIEKVIVHIKSNMWESISVKTMADMAGLSERRFRQVFKDITGMQPKKYVDNLKIGMAEELLKNTPFSLSEISDRLGYSSQFHFSKAFKKIRGMTPSRYRRINKQEISKHIYKF